MTSRVAARLVRAAVAGALFAGSLRGQVPGVVRGRLTDARSARPIADGRVEIDGRAEYVRSSADGTFLVRGLEARSYTVRLSALGYRARLMDVEVTNGRTTSIDAPLDPVGAPLRGVVVSAAPDTSSTSSTVFDRAAIEVSGRRDLGELLQNTPGVVVTQAGGPGSATRVSFRGSAANEVLVMIDGVPINSAITGDVDLSLLTLEGIERVTVRTGARSARYGGRALAGVIEIQTRRASREASALLRNGAWGDRQASFTVGSGWDAGSARVASALTADYRAVRGDFPYERPAFRGGGLTRRVNSDVASRQLQGTLSLAHASDRIGIRGVWQDLSRGLAGSISQPSPTGRQGSARLSGGVDARLQLHRLSWVAAGDITHERTTYQDPAPPFATRFDDTVQVTGAMASTSVAAGRGAVQASLGGEVRRLDIESTMLSVGAPRVQRLLGAWASLRGTRSLQRIAAYVDAELSTRADDNSLGGERTISPHGTARLRRGAAALSLSLGTGFAPPSLSDQFFHEGVLVRPNPALRAERTRGDLEARLAVLDRAYGPILFTGDAAVYRADIDGMILWQPDFRFIWSPSNVDVRRSGWELSARGALPAAGIDVQGGVNRSNVSYAGPVLDGQVVYRPRTTAAATLGITQPNGRLEFSHRFIGERRTVAGSSLNLLHPYRLTDARVRTSLVRPAWTIDATLGVENLFDQEAAMLVDYPFPGRTWTLTLRLKRNARVSALPFTLSGVSRCCAPLARTTALRSLVAPSSR